MGFLVFGFRHSISVVVGAARAVWVFVRVLSVSPEESARAHCEIYRYIYILVYHSRRS